MTDIALVACIEMGQPVADHHPVDILPIAHESLLALFPNHDGIPAWFDHLQRVGIDAGQQIYIYKTVIYRCEQQVGIGMAYASKIGVTARAVEQDEIMLRGQLVNGSSELRRFFRGGIGLRP